MSGRGGGCPSAGVQKIASKSKENQCKSTQIQQRLLNSIQFHQNHQKSTKTLKIYKTHKNQRKSFKKTQNVHKSTKNDVLGREAFFLKSISFYKDKSLGDAPARGGCPSAGSRSMRGFRVRTYVHTYSGTPNSSGEPLANSGDPL